MKLTKKNLNPLIWVVSLTAIGGTLAWFILELIFAAAGKPFSLSTGKIGFDVMVISFYLNTNPGTLLGLISGFFVFKII